MKTCSILFFLSLLFCFQQNAAAQNLAVTYTNCNDLNVCIADTFSVSVRNLSAQAATNVSVKISFSNGMGYVPGTVTGASQQNISNLQEPVFSFTSIGSGLTSVLKFQLTADCAAGKALDMGSLFPALIEVQSSVGSAQVPVSTIPLNTGLLLIQSVDDVQMTGERFDTLLRTICVRNTRPGSISEFYFEDEHKVGFQVDIPNAINTLQTATKYKSNFGSAFISAFGDHDNLLEFNESVCFTEKIVIYDCGTPQNNNESVLRVGWGCGGEICSYDSLTNIGIAVKESTRVPKLKMVPVWNPPLDFCGNIGTPSGIKIINEGRAPAKNVIVKVRADDPERVGIDGNSFRLVGSFGTIPIPANTLKPSLLPYCGTATDSSVTVTVPMVADLDSATLLFNYVSCAETCDQLLPSFTSEYFYQKECPPNGFVSERLYINADQQFRLNSSLILNATTCFQDGETYNFQYNLHSKRLTEQYGFINLLFDVPQSLFWSSNCVNQLGGVNPLSITQVPGTDQNTLVTLTFQLPLPNDTVSMPFCLRYGCDSTSMCVPDTALQYTNGVTHYFDPTGICSNVCTVRFPVKTTWILNAATPLACGTTSCDEMYLGLSRSACKPDDGVGPVDTVIPYDVYPAHYIWNSRVYRSNYGYEDKLDDRTADGTGIAKMQDVDLTRYLPYDSMRTEYNVYVDSGAGLLSFFRIVQHRISINDMNKYGNDSFNIQTAQSGFMAKERFRLLYDSIRIKYKDGAEYKLPYNTPGSVFDKRYYRFLLVNTYPPVVDDEYVYISFYKDIRFDSLFSQGLLPKPSLEQGDSFFVYTGFKLDFNFKPASNNNPDPPLVGFQTRLADYIPGKQFNTTFIHQNQYSGYKNTWTSSVFSLKPCDNSTQSKAFNLRFRIARENMFPHEVRPIAWINDFWQTMPLTAVPVSAKLKYLALQDSTIRLNNVPLPFTQSPGRLDIDFSPAFADPVDEGFMLGTDVTFGPDCRFGKPDSSRQHLTLKFFNRPDSMVENKFSSLGYYSNLPELHLQSNDTLVYVTRKNFDIEFNISNEVVPPAPNMWISPLSVTGKATDFKLVQLPQQQTVTGTADVFQLGNLSGLNQRSYRLTGLNNSCETDTLLLIYGWDCSPVQASAQNTCGRDTFFILLRKESPELDMKILQEPIPITLCDTSDYYEIEVFNAKRGYAYDLDFSTTLPPGLRIVPGTCQISYPFGSSYVTVSDPALNNGQYQWSVNAIQALIAANGLPGDNASPQNTTNKFGIRFKTIAECGFVGNIQPIFGVKGLNPCGEATNYLNRAGTPVSVNGLNQAYGVIITLDPVGTAQPYCGGEQTFKCNLTLLGQPSQNDSVFVLIPSASAYVTGSYVAGTNAPPTAFVASGQQIVVHIPPGLSNGSSLNFTFKVRFESGAGCDIQSIKAQSRVSTPVFCQSLGAPCDIYVVTGEATRPIDVQHPQLALDNAAIQLNGNQVNATFNVNNTGAVPASSVTAQVWNDVNGNGMLEPGTDQLLTTILQNQGLQPGQSLALTANFDGPVLNFCNLIVVLPAAENCLCEDRLLPLHNADLQFEEQQFCNNQPITIGTAMEAGIDYKWLTTNGILCDTCATTTYTPPASVQPGVAQTLVLEAQSGVCKLQYNYKVVFGNVYSVTPVNATICQGMPVTLNAQSAGGTYLWSGPGIVDPTLAQITVTPEVSTVYHLTISFLPAPCSVDTTIAIEVIHGDTIQLDELFTCKGVPVQVLNQNTDVAGLYTKEQTNANGCKDLVQQRLTVYNNVMTEEPRQLCLGDTLDLPKIDTSFTTSGKVCRTYQTINGCDSVHCVIVTALEPPQLENPDTLYGQVLKPIELIGKPGFTSYIWHPAIPPCANCQDLTVQFDTAGFYEYVLTIGDGNGCVDTVVYRILVFPPCSAKHVLVPNAFSPNGDQVNDTFKVVDREGSELIGSITIYDRWGQKVYESTTELFWDGMIDDQPAPSDVYVYIIEVLCDGSREKLVGDVTVLR